VDEKTSHAGLGTETPETLDSLWRQFVRANSEKEFCTAWLALQCSTIPGVASGVVLLVSPEEGRPYALAASWPEGHGDFKRLAEVAERALKEKRGLALKRQSNGTAESRTSYDLAYPVHVAGRTFGVVALDIDSKGEAALRDAMRQLQWGSAWMEVLCHRNSSSKDTAPLQRLQTVATLLSQVTAPKSFHGAVVALATAMATRFECDRVSIGFLKRGSIRIEAMSHAGQFNQDTNLVRAIDAAMNEAMDQNSSIVFPDAPQRKAVASRAHSKLARDSGNAAICSVPLAGRDRTVGVITLERATSAPFDEETVAICESLAGLVGRVVQARIQVHRDDIAAGHQLPGHLDPARQERIGMLPDLDAVEEDRGGQVQPLEVEPRPSPARGGGRGELAAVRPEALLDPACLEGVELETWIADPPRPHEVEVDLPGNPRVQVPGGVRLSVHDILHPAAHAIRPAQLPRAVQAE